MAKHYLGLSNILKKILYERRINPSELARQVKLPSPTIHRLVTGKSTRPYRSSLEPIANYLSITVEQLLGEAPLENSLLSDTEASIIKKVPLVPLEQINQSLSINTDDFKKIPVMEGVGIKGFATTLEDSSMEPLFFRGSILIFDPDKKPKDRSFVLVKLQEAQSPVFRELLVDADQRYLKSQNLDLNEFQIRVLDSNDYILGTLVEARKCFSGA